MTALPCPLAYGAGCNPEIRRCGFNLNKEGLCFAHTCQVSVKYHT